MGFSLGKGRGIVLSCALAISMALSGTAWSGDQSKSVEKLTDWNLGGDWPAFGRTFGEQHYSPLDEINQETVGDLGLAWSMDLGPGNSVTGPIAVDGVLFFATAYSLVRAANAVTGELLWTYDPKAAEVSGRKLRQGWGIRGLAWWNDKIYVGTQDGRLIALEAATGKLVWSVMTTEKDDLRFISGAPRVFDGKIIVGHGGADGGSTRGYVTTYDAETGEQLWRFYTVPGNPADGFENEAMEMAAKTWFGEWWKYGGGGTAWNAMTYDAETDTVFVGTGNGAPWNHRIRSEAKGDNLFLSSILALDADTGAYKWHYQTNPGETWDYNAAMDMQLAELEIDGKVRKVLMTAPKNGFFYVIDRLTGELISGKPIVRVTWATGIDLNTGRPIEAPGVRYAGGQSVEIAPSPMGGHTWLPMSFSPRTGLVYVPTIELSAVFDDKGITTEAWTRDPNNDVDGAVNAAFPLDAKGESFLVAWDPVRQEPVWKLPMPGYWNGGTVATAGDLVFQGRIDGTFNAYAAADGTKLWSFEAKAPVLAPPITYAVDGQQYVTVFTGMGTSGGYLGPLLEKFGLNPRTQARRVLTFKIGGDTPLPETAAEPLEFADDPDFQLDQASADRGNNIFARKCAICHGFRAVSVGAAADLRGSYLPQSSEDFAEVVSQGGLVSMGMPQFDELSETELNDVRHYIRMETATAKVDKESAKLD